MRVLGIDPGTQVCGYGIVDADGSDLKAVDYGVVRCARGSLPERLRVIHDGLKEIVARYRPETAAVEGVFYGKNARTAMKIGEARGMVLVTLASAGLEVAEYAPATVKQSVVGSGRADKAQVQQMVRLILALPCLPEPPDAADALALAICHCHRARLRELI
jgi:crossover junction endodeoxyribonuclease RuvC